MHALYVTAHAVGVCLHQHDRDRYQDALTSIHRRPMRLNQVHSPYAVGRTAQWVRRMDVCESTAGRYRGGRFVEAFPGAVTRPVEDGTRISRTLTAWDIQAHRTLASERWLANMRHIAGTQAVLARAGGVLVEAAQLTGDAGVRASLDVIAARPGLERGTRATLHALESGSELAFVVAEKARPPRSDRTRPGALSPRAQRHRRWPGRPPG
jgi:hypothetical protein